jgi:hypothetical protein
MQNTKIYCHRRAFAQRSMRPAFLRAGAAIAALALARRID